MYSTFWCAAESSVPQESGRWECLRRGGGGGGWQVNASSLNAQNACQLQKFNFHKRREDACTFQVAFLLLGYLFGGLYSDTVNNVITKTKKCPIKFYPQRFGPKDMYVCISDDYELGAQYSIPFGGFMSCTAGNPLAMTPQKGKNVL